MFSISIYLVLDHCHVQNDLTLTIATSKPNYLVSIEISALVAHLQYDTIPPPSADIILMPNKHYERRG